MIVKSAITAFCRDSVGDLWSALPSAPNASNGTQPRRPSRREPVVPWEFSNVTVAMPTVEAYCVAGLEKKMGNLCSRCAPPCQQPSTEVP
jgi:hypothetical protein